jgi:hypothetical protein
MVANRPQNALLQSKARNTIAQPEGAERIQSLVIHREAIKHRFDPPLLPAPRRAATGGSRCVVGTYCAQRQRSFRVTLTHPARCEHRRRKRGQGLAFLVTFWAMPKSDWPRAAIEHARRKHFSSFHQPLRQAQGERWGAIFSVTPPPSPQPSPALRAREQMAAMSPTGLVSIWVRWDRTPQTMEPARRYLVRGTRPIK